MLASALSVASLFLSVGLLLLGHGIYLTLLPQMADGFGWSAAQNALTTSAYFLGYGGGCFLIPRWLQIIGHIRVFSVLVASATAILLVLSLVADLGLWIVLRFVYGIAISGIYLSVESWLNAATNPAHRGKVLALYAFITLIAILAAQVILERLVISGYAPLVIAAIFVSLAALPIGVTRREAPQLVVRPHLRADLLFKRANIAILFCGILNGTFWALGPIMAARMGFGADGVARFMAVAVAGGMLTVYPLGLLSDRFGRTRVLAVTGIFGAVATGLHLAFADGSEAALLRYGCVFGAAAMPLYSLCLALANDYASNDEFVETGSTVIVVNAAGMVIGPALCGLIMTDAEPATLAWFWAANFFALALAVTFAGRRPPRAADTAPFALVPRSVQEVLAIDPRAPHDDEETVAAPTDIDEPAADPPDEPALER